MCKNCEDESEFLTVDVLKDVSIDPVEELVTNKEETEVDLSTSSGEALHNSKVYHENSSLESCSVVYFAGYLAKKCVDLLLCKDCDLT